jgi:predicted nuclease with RNAse H fold
MTEQSYANAPRPAQVTAMSTAMITAANTAVTTNGESLVAMRQVDFELLAQEVRLLQQELRDLQALLHRTLTVEPA